ncbi:MAG: hypothetical protein ACK55I_33555, partial [bacterium]
MRRDPGQDLRIHSAGVGLRERGELPTKRRLRVPPGDVAVQLGQVVPLHERRRQRALAGGRLADADDVRPAALIRERRRAGDEIFGVGMDGGRRLGRHGPPLERGLRCCRCGPGRHHGRDHAPCPGAAAGRRRGTNASHGAIHFGKPHGVAAASGPSFGRSRLWNTFAGRAKSGRAVATKNLAPAGTPAPTIAAGDSTAAGDTLVRWGSWIRSRLDPYSPREPHDLSGRHASLPGRRAGGIDRRGRATGDDGP